VGVPKKSVPGEIASRGSRVHAHKSALLGRSRGTISISTDSRIEDSASWVVYGFVDWGCAEIWIVENKDVKDSQVVLDYGGNQLVKWILDLWVFGLRVIYFRRSKRVCPGGREDEKKQ